MNNRMMGNIGPPRGAGGREKRSYEFLMGLVNNNSKYEVTRVDPSAKSQLNTQESDANATASELLLELMVKIAAHPDHWDKVHRLLEKIDSDLLASKKIVDDLQKAEIKIEPKPLPQRSSAPSAVKKEEGKNKSGAPVSSVDFSKNQWPSFADGDEEEEEDPSPRGKVSFVAPTENYRFQGQHKSLPYPKTFAYHRVTGRPMYLNKNPKAYIAVSVIAPKPINTRSSANVHGDGQDDGDDLTLEKQLRQLKPWTHNQNLKNMASIRSRWVIQSKEDKKDPVVAP